MEAAEEVVDRGARSRRAIIDAAAPIFAAHGYTGASLNRIIEASGLTKGGFYFHFPSKQSLALAVLADQNERWMAQVMAEAGRHSDLVDRLNAVPRILARMAIRQEGPASFRKLVDELSLDPEIHDEVCGSLRMWVRSAADQFREGQAAGIVKPEFDPEQLAEIAVGAFVGMQTMTEQLGDGELERRIESLLAFIQAAVQIPPRKGGKQ